MQALLHRTEAGDKASEQSDCSLPREYLLALRAVGEISHFEDVAIALPQCAKPQVATYLEDLEAIGLIEFVEMEWLLDLCRLADLQARDTSDHLSCRR